jgi:fucose permease
VFQDTIFNWSSTEKGNILGAFFYGYILTSFIGGLAANKFGGHIVCF